MPEVEVARRSGWGEDYWIPVGEPLPALVSDRSAIGEGQSRKLSTTATIPAPGYYRVVATVFKRSDEANVVDGYIVHSGTHRELWLWIDERGGHVTESFDASLISAEYVPQPGPRRSRAAKGVGTESQSQFMPAGLLLSTASTGTIRYRLLFYNKDTGSYDPVPRADYRVEYWDYDASRSGTMTGYEEGSTDSDGYLVPIRKLER
jgi:hypothetical protein